MARPRKPRVNSREWLESELAIAEQRLRTIRKQISVAGPRELPALLRLELTLRAEIRRLADLAQPQVVTDQSLGSFDALLDELRSLPTLDDEG